MTVSFYTVVNSEVKVLDDFVISCGELFLFKRNRDFSPVINSFDMDLSKGGSTPIPVVPTIGMVVVLKVDGADRASYSVTYVFDDTIDHKYSITLTSRLNALNIPLCSTNLHALIADTSGLSIPLHYYNADDAGYSLRGGYVMILWAVKNMFTKVGLSLDISQVEYLINGYYNGREVRNRDYMMDLGMFWAINQNKAMAAYYINDSNEYKAQRITFWDFVSLVCSFFGWKIFENGVDSYILRDMNYGSEFAFSDDDKYGHAVKRFEAKNSSAKATFRYHTVRDDYYGAPVDLNAQNTGEESDSRQESLLWYNNMLIGIINISFNAIDRFFSIDDHDIMARRNQYNSLTRPYYQETVKTEMIGDIYNCLEQSIDIEKRLSRIVKEVIE